MAGFYKVVLRGVAAGQEINNILYYSPIDPSFISFLEADASDLGAAVNAAWKNQVFGVLASTYAFQGCDVSMVDENGEILSPYVVSVPDTGNGGDAIAPETVGMVLIAKFNCTPVSQVAPHPVPRRSYLAIGPITAAQGGASGLVDTPSNKTTAFTAAFAGSHLINGTIFYPYRVGRTTAPSAENPDGTLAGVGRVHSVVCRPYVSFRRSRLFSPTGN